MNTLDILEFTKDLIALPSISGSEGQVSKYLKRVFDNRSWKVELLPVTESRENVFVSFGTPQIVFSTHIDVVPGNDELFTPQKKGDLLFGRGACDAKGIVATMVAVAESLIADNETNFGLLFVVGEESDGIGAQNAAKQLLNKGIRYIINGEPTEGKVMKAHKGGLALTVTFTGAACHSGYPSLGEDANSKLLRTAARLLDVKWPSDPVFGETTMNIGLIKGGTAQNVISPSSSMNILFRTVTDNEILLETVRQYLSEANQVKISYNVPPVNLLEFQDLKTGIASFCTDIPNFMPLGVECVLYGPGSILVAHTDKECISIKDIEESIEGYRLIFHRLKNRLP